MSGFKNFIMRGNLVELAVAVVIGTQFSNLVKQFVSSFINPLLALFGGKPDFSNLLFTVGTPRMHDEHPGRRQALPGIPAAALH